MNDLNVRMYKLLSPKIFEPKSPTINEPNARVKKLNFEIYIWFNSIYRIGL